MEIQWQWQWKTTYVFCLRGVRIYQHQILLSSFCCLCNYYFQMNVSVVSWWDSSLSATFISFGGHNIYRGSNCRFCNGWTDGQTEFIVIISFNVAADDGDEIKESCVVTLLSYRDFVELLEIKVVTCLNFFRFLLSIFFVRIGYRRKISYAANHCFSTKFKNGTNFFQMK